MASILLIDDEDSIRFLLRTALEQAGYEVIDALTGRDGLRQVRASPPALIITDVIMPDTDGFEVLMALRREGVRIPIIVLTGAHEDSAYCEAARLLGAQRVMKKPFEISQLLQAVEKELQQGSPRIRGHSPQENE